MIHRKPSPQTAQKTSKIHQHYGMQPAFNRSQNAVRKLPSIVYFGINQDTRLSSSFYVLKFCTGFSRTCTPKFKMISPFSVLRSPFSGHLNSKFTTIEGFWVQFLQKSKLKKIKNLINDSRAGEPCTPCWDTNPF